MQLNYSPKPCSCHLLHISFYTSFLCSVLENSTVCREHSQPFPNPPPPPYPAKFESSGPSNLSALSSERSPCTVEKNAICLFHLRLNTLMSLILCALTNYGAWCPLLSFASMWCFVGVLLPSLVTPFKLFFPHVHVLGNFCSSW